MKFCRYNDNRIGIVRDDGVHDVTEILKQLPQLTYPFPLGDQLIMHLDELREPMETLANNAAALDPTTLDFLSPVANPSKIMGTPGNYAKHVAEARADAEISQYDTTYMDGRRKRLGEQGLFLKANSALVGPSEGVTIRFPDRRTDHEAELGVVIGKIASHVTEAEALDYVAGYAIALDMVTRGPESRSFRKSADSYAVLGPWLVTPDEIDDPDNMNFKLTVGGEVRQQANTKDMIYDIKKQIAWGSSFYTLYPGDILMSGTCEGVGPVVPGDVMELEFDGVGRMEVPVHASN